MMTIMYTLRIEDFEDVSVTADALVPKLHRIRGGLILAGCLSLVAPYLTGAGPSHPDQFLLGMSPLGLCLIVAGL
jgi:hypothetical protein